MKPIPTRLNTTQNDKSPNQNSDFLPPTGDVMENHQPSLCGDVIVPYPFRIDKLHCAKNKSFMPKVGSVNIYCLEMLGNWVLATSKSWTRAISQTAFFVAADGETPTPYTPSWPTQTTKAMICGIVFHACTPS